MTVRLAGLAIQHWQTLDGYAVGHGLPDLRELPLGRLVNLVWWFLTKEAQPTEVEKFRAKLWIPPKGVEAPQNSPWSRENELKSFGALRAQLGM